MSILRRITNLFHRSKLDEDIDAELRSHIEMRTADSIAAGVSPEEVRCSRNRRIAVDISEMFL